MNAAFTNFLYNTVNQAYIINSQSVKLINKPRKRLFKCMLLFHTKAILIYLFIANWIMGFILIPVYIIVLLRYNLLLDIYVKYGYKKIILIVISIIIAAAFFCLSIEIRNFVLHNIFMIW